MPRNVDNVIDELNQLVASVGLQKLASVVADPGTAQPAKQDPAKANIEPAKTGAQAAENSAAVKEQVLGLPVDKSNPKDAENGPEPKNAPEKITTATTVGKDPSVEQNYGSAKEQGNYPGTTHPADVNKNNEKYSSVSDMAAAILKEASVIKEASAEGVTEENIVEKLGNFISTAENLEKKAEVTKAAADQAVKEYIEGYVKMASLVGELSADYLDGMLLKASNEGEEVGEEAGGGEPVGGDVDGDGDASEDAAVEAILEEAAAVAQELGVEPEDVLEAALAEEEGGEEMELGGEEGGEPISAEELAMLSGAGAPAAAEAAPEQVPMEVVASFVEQKDGEIAKLKEKLAAYENEKTAAANDQKLASLINNTMDSWWTKKQAELTAK